MEPEVNFDNEAFEKKLLNLKDTQDSIQGLSSWCLHHRAAHKKIVTTWLSVLKTGKYNSVMVLVPKKFIRITFSHHTTATDSVLSG